MHDDLKALLSRGWAFGLRFDALAEVFRATGQHGVLIVRAAGAEPMQSLAMAMLEAQRVEMEKAK